jgi:hypothetical protein
MTTPMASGATPAVLFDNAPVLAETFVAAMFDNIPKAKRRRLIFPVSGGVAIILATGAWVAPHAAEQTNVIEMERQPGECFRAAAILTSVPSPGTDGFVNRLIPCTDSAGAGLVQRKACFRLEKLQGSADIEMVIQLTFFGGRQLADVSLFRKFANPLCVRIRDTQSQPLASGLRG